MNVSMLIAGCGTLLLASSAVAQTAQTTPTAPPTETLSDTPVISPPIGSATTVPAGTILEIEVAEPLNSSSARVGQRFKLRLASPLVVGGSTIMPAGIEGEGEVVHAARAGGSGKPGELTLAGRFLLFEGRQIGIRGLQLTGRGTSLSGAATGFTVAAGFVAPMAGFAVLLVPGGNIEIPLGLRANAKLRADLPIAPMAASTTELPQVRTAAP